MKGVKRKFEEDDNFEEDDDGFEVYDWALWETAESSSKVIESSSKVSTVVPSLVLVLVLVLLSSLDQLLIMILFLLALESNVVDVDDARSHKHCPRKQCRTRPLSVSPSLLSRSHHHLLLLGAQFGTGSSNGKGSSLLSFGAGVGLELSGGKKQKSEQTNTVSTSSIVMINLATIPMLCRPPLNFASSPSSSLPDN
jgi:hypothetical protein